MGGNSLERGSNHQSTKIQNRCMVLKIICTGTNVTRIDISRQTGLSKMSISNIVNELIAESYVTDEAGQLKNDSIGRNPISLEPNTEIYRVLGIYISRDHAIATLSNLKCDILSEIKCTFSFEESENSFIEKVNGVEMLVSVKRIDKLNWNIVSVSPMKKLNKELNAYSKFVYIVITICGLLSFMVALILSNDISRPIRKLVKSMSHVKEGNFDINISYNRNDEFAFLVQQYKSMINEIKELIDKLYISELRQKEVELKAREYELKALQAQINPHFLYNTLDSVNWLALKYNANDISIMVKSLSNFFRYSLSKGKSEITLEEEKGQVESYLTIQSIRFKEKLNYKIDFSEEILKCKTVKLILQPIVENAIIHGIERRKSGGFINISGYKKEDYIEITVSDNGEGADVEKLNNLLLDKTVEDSFFGTRNVNDRIKQFFGEEYGLNFCNNEEGGLTVVIKIPFKK